MCPPGHPLPRDPGILAPSPLRPPAGPRAWVVSPQDKLCGAFWRLVLAQRWMGRLKTVAGSEMEKLLEDVNTEIHFVTSCAFQVSPELGGQVQRACCFPRDWQQRSARPYWRFPLDWEHPEGGGAGTSDLLGPSVGSDTSLSTGGYLGVRAKGINSTHFSGPVEGCC